MFIIILCLVASCQSQWAGSIMYGLQTDFYVTGPISFCDSIDDCYDSMCKMLGRKDDYANATFVGMMIDNSGDFDFCLSKYTSNDYPAKMIVMGMNDDLN